MSTASAVSRSELRHPSGAVRPRASGPGWRLPTQAEIDAAQVHYREWGLVAVFVGLVIVYAGVGLWLSFGHGLILGDALSRVASARFALFSREPHLSAIGFVFTPLTTVLELPLVAIMNPWPTLLAHAVPAIIVSAFFMSGAVLMIMRLCVDRGMSRGWSYGLGAAFALHPFVIYYGGNGMSEAPFLFFMAVVVRCLQRWMVSDDVHDLVFVGLSLAGAFLVRYDALAAAIAVAVCVYVTSWHRNRWLSTDAPAAGRMDTAIVLAPIVTAFALWTGVSWLISGEAFAQFSSQYGNSAIIAQSGGASLPLAQRPVFTLVEWLILEPMVLAVLLSALVVTIIRRVPDAVPAVVGFGSVLGFQALTFAGGSTFPFLRFAIVVIPATVTLAAIHRPRRGRLTSRRAGPAARLVGSVGRPQRIRILSTRVGAVVALVPAFFVCWWGMSQPTYAPQEYPVPAIVTPGMVDAQTRLQAAQQARTFATERELAAYLDSLGLPDGAVLTDTVYGFAVVVASDHPQQFVIPSDSDFVTILNDPAGHHVQYLLTVPNTGRGTSDAINRRYPTIYDNGAQISTLALEIPSSGTGQPTYRLYRVTADM